MFPARPVRVGTVLAAGVLVVLTACGRGGPDDGAEPANGSPAAEQTTEPESDLSARTSDGSTDLPSAEPAPRTPPGPGVTAPTATDPTVPLPTVPLPAVGATAVGVPTVRVPAARATAVRVPAAGTAARAAPRPLLASLP